MKRVKKGSEPTSLVEYKVHSPQQTWEGLRNDGLNNGSSVVEDCYEQTWSDQGGLCAYCESKIDRTQPGHCRIEHFHPKSDTSTAINWGLDWQNMLAVCLGGERSSELHPLPTNLSCDAHKNHFLGKSEYEGWILNPLHLPPHVNLFALNKRNGHLLANANACSSIPLIVGNKHKTNEDLVNNTITVLNLNCDRLADLRRKVIINIDRNKQQMRHRHVRREDAPGKLIERYFSEHWPEFFTTIRWCIPEVEFYLKSINYSG